MDTDNLTDEELMKLMLQKIRRVVQAIDDGLYNEEDPHDNMAYGLGEIRGVLRWARPGMGIGDDYYVVNGFRYDGRC